MRGSGQVSGCVLFFGWRSVVSIYVLLFEGDGKFVASLTTDELGTQFLVELLQEVQ